MASRKEMMEKRQKALREANSGSGGYKYFLIKKGVTRLRMPQVVDGQEFCQEVLFFFLGKDIGGVISPASYGEPCPIKELYDKFRTSGDEDDKALAEKIKPKRRFMGPFYKFNDEAGKELDTEAGVKLALLTGGLYQDMCDMFLDDEYGDFTDPKEGYDIKFSRTGEGQFNTEYSARGCKSTRIKKEFSKEIYNPEEMVRALIPTYEEAEELLNKFLGVGSSDEDEEVKPKKKKPSGKKKKKKSTDL